MLNDMTELNDKYTARRADLDDIEDLGKLIQRDKDILDQLYGFPKLVTMIE
jgi:hypothetical protein